MRPPSPPLTIAREATAADLRTASVTCRWPDDHGPALWVYTGGVWAYCAVIARWDWADGRSAYGVILCETRHRRLVERRPVYWWEPGAMRRAWRHGQAGGISAYELPARTGA